MKINTKTEIEHLDGVVNIKISMAPEDFIKFVESIKKTPVNTLKAKVAEAPDLTAKKKAFVDLINIFKNANPGVHPDGLYNQFYAYWSEASKNGKKIRYEGESYFDVGKRLATFRRNVKPEELSKLWIEHNNAINQKKTV